MFALEVYKPTISMKKISYYLPFLLLCFVITCISCDDEQLEGEFFTTPDGQEIVIDDSPECQAALTAFQQASLELQNADPANSAAACAALSTALDNFVFACGVDTTDASVMAAMTLLNGCADMTNNCTTATANAATAQTAFENATPENEVALCNAYTIALQAQIAACGDADGSIQNIINGLNCVDQECADATTATEEALAIFNMTDITDEAAYVEACGNYSLALQDQIIICGDPDGSLQAIVDELGDCSIPEDPGPVQMTIDEEFKNFNVAEAPINGSTFEVTATDVDTGDTFEFSVTLLQTGENVLQNIVLTIDGVMYNPVLSGDPQFINEITQNDGEVIIGTFSGPMMNADGDVINITGGIIDIEI
ncbi:hypothetical protein GCM10011344_02790 [Dokdonia pacifica]|uniref:Uncharacterized protein n=2 Tax=Dokdonia pacifica TaxID=1627892 RepID=A0A238ZE70_9FLAO|nr:hypothetical protein GCM10011344_02790 [Dokdonia pacifica]SNR81382.1 hypothetical protein SAMN06265376_103140 [Dokdonia pacifica]